MRKKSTTLLPKVSITEKINKLNTKDNKQNTKKPKILSVNEINLKLFWNIIKDQSDQNNSQQMNSVFWSNCY